MNLVELQARLLLRGIGIALVGAVMGLGNPAAGKVQAETQTAKLSMNATFFAVAPREAIPIADMHVPLTFTDVKPAAITKEPKYWGKPKYAVIHLGNGPKSAYNLAFDEPADGKWKVYIDKNQNGDLTDDGDGQFTKKNMVDGSEVYGINNYVLRASWGTATAETSHSDYGIGIYQFAENRSNAFVFREAAAAGELTLAGKKHKVLLVEDDGDALYNKTLPTDADTGKPLGEVIGHAVWLLVDLKSDGKFSAINASAFDVRAPFKIGDVVYEANVAEDGASISLVETSKAVADLTKQQIALEPSKPKEPSGPPAPNFRAILWGGGSVQPTDFRGKVLILDFWATWCGPCQQSMPHIERVFRAVKDKNVAVLALCVWDDKDACAKWVLNNQSKYSFTVAFDPAGKDTKNSIAKKLFNVTGIPTTYIIDRDGNIAASIVGYESGDTRVEDALKKLGVDISADSTK